MELLIFLLIPVVMYFLLIRPQKKRQREQAERLSALDVGDEVITTSGIYGFITGTEEDDKFWLQIDEDVQIRIARAAIQGKVVAAQPPAAEEGKDSTPSGDADDSGKK